MPDTPNERISVTQAYNDQSVICQIRNLKRDKQEKLIAGPGVNISEQNVISTQSAAPNWGQIGGDIQDQTDLQTALAAKADSSDLTALESRVTEAEGDIAELQSDVGDAVTDAVSGATSSSSQYIQKIIFTKKDGNTFDIASAPINYHTPATDPTAKTEGISRYGVGVALAGKQDAGNYATQTDLQQGLATREPLLSDAQHAAVNSGITAVKVGQYDANIYDPTPITAFVSFTYIWGVATYHRTGHKKGILSMSIYVSNSAPSTYDYIAISQLSAALGVNFKIPTSSRITGHWYGTADMSNLFGYGSVVAVKNNGYIELQRAYNTYGAMGGWDASILADQRFILEDIYIEEI